MMNHIITVGLFDQDTHKQEHGKSYYIETVIDAINRHHFCATLETEGIYGIYQHMDGTRICEPSIRFNVAGVTRAEILPLVRELRAALNQESIMLESEEKNIVFVDAEYKDE